MITKITIKNFRQIEYQTIDLAQSVVIVGPNNGGKSTLLQAISLFALAIKAWNTHRASKKSKGQTKSSAAINLHDLLNIPVSDIRELWRNLTVKEGATNEAGKPISKNIRITIIAEGYTNNQTWETGFEFGYANNALIYARLTQNDQGLSYNFPPVLSDENIGYLPSVAGLKPTEDKLEIGSILRHIGNGNTSNVLRNVCYLLYDKNDKSDWQRLVKAIDSLFKVELNAPQYIPATGLLEMTYKEGAKKSMDLSSLGSGAKQAILLFAYLFAFPNTVNLLDEPDAHLEVIRQSNIYDKISDLAKERNSQLIIASHSESVMNRAFGKDQVISCMFGQFEQVNQDKAIKSVLRDIGYQEFLIAKQHPYILYFEGTTDLDFIKAFCKKLNLPDINQFIENNVCPYPIGNHVERAKQHFSALKKFIPNLRGYAIFDNLSKNTTQNIPSGLRIKQWERKEIENYIPIPQTLSAYGQILDPSRAGRLEQILADRTPPAALRDLGDAYWKSTKISDDLLTPVFRAFFQELKMPIGTMDKSKFYQLVAYIDTSLLDPELLNTINELYLHLTKP